MSTSHSPAGSDRPTLHRSFSKHIGIEHTISVATTSATKGETPSFKWDTDDAYLCCAPVGSPSWIRSIGRSVAISASTVPVTCTNYLEVAIEHHIQTTRERIPSVIKNARPSSQ